ncbi:MAG: hypothetical protein SOY25_03105 [Eubacteriales bacterium]|nr:hypothetical protein [Eubacteriales bacterium]
MKELYFYPTLNETIAKDFGIEVEDFVFSYNDMTLKVDETGVLRNPAEKTWLVQNNGMIMRTSIRLKTPEKLYGKDGVACSGAKIGFYAIWSNPSTMQSDSRLLDSIDGVKFELSQYFAPEMVKGTLNVTIHAFVASPAETVPEEESFLMNDIGVSIGIVASKSVLLNDEHLSFPIIKVKDDNKPLWWVTLDWEDPKVERFDNCVTVFLNKKFKTYPKSGKDAEFLCTILASVYFLIIKKLRINDDEVMRSIFNGSDDFEEFSVCDVMSHFCGMLQYLDFEGMKKLNDEKLMAELQREINAMCGGALQ